MVDIGDDTGKKPPFVLLENVDRLIKSPAKQRGRDFGIILACFRDECYTVEWRVINAADYGFQQRRRRIFMFAYRNDTAYGRRKAKESGYSQKTDISGKKESMKAILETNGFFAKSFPVYEVEYAEIKADILPNGLVDLSDNYVFAFDNAGIMKDGTIYTVKTIPQYDGNIITLGQIVEDGDVPESFFVPKERLYYTSPEITHSDESGVDGRLSDEARKTWQYIKGAKRLLRKADNGHEYVYSEGAVPMVDAYDKPARTMLTSEGSFSRTTHIIIDKKTQRIRLLTPIEMERIQGFPSDWTKECLVGGNILEMPLTKRRFMMGNALVVDLVRQMEEQLSEIFDLE